jgi:hypothetical protein
MKENPNHEQTSRFFLPVMPVMPDMPEAWPLACLALGWQWCASQGLSRAQLLPGPWRARGMRVFFRWSAVTRAWQEQN